MTQIVDPITDKSGREFPRYRCHKEVWALKIKEVQREVQRERSGTLQYVGAVLIPEEPEYTSIRVDRDFLLKHDPAAGGYLVVYADGYKSFSPAQAFEEGYTRI